jgi:hypothetical protein
MTDDASRLTDINVHPTYQASLRLTCGATVRVTVLDGAILTDIRDDEGRSVGARMTENEATEFASMHYAAARNC